MSATPKLLCQQRRRRRHGHGMMAGNGRRRRPKAEEKKKGLGRPWSKTTAEMHTRVVKVKDRARGRARGWEGGMQACSAEV
jgi:hypothetical protein